VREERARAQHHRHHRPGGQEGDAEGCTEREAVPDLLSGGLNQECQARAAGRKRGEVGHRLVRVHDQADRAHQQQRGARAGRAAFALRGGVPRRQVQEPQGGHHQRPAGEARRVVETEQSAEGLGAGEGKPVVERGVLEPGLAGEARDQPVSRQVHLVRDFDRDDVEPAPRVVSDQSRRDERQGDQDENGVRRW
jgi:hypothetical protein